MCKVCKRVRPLDFKQTLLLRKKTCVWRCPDVIIWRFCVAWVFNDYAYYVLNTKWLLIKCKTLHQIAFFVTVEINRWRNVYFCTFSPMTNTKRKTEVKILSSCKKELFCSDTVPYPVYQPKCNVHWASSSVNRLAPNWMRISSMKYIYILLMIRCYVSSLLRLRTISNQANIYLIIDKGIFR